MNSKKAVSLSLRKTLFSLGIFAGFGAAVPAMALDTTPGCGRDYRPLDALFAVGGNVPSDPEVNFKDFKNTDSLDYASIDYQVRMSGGSKHIAQNFHAKETRVGPQKAEIKFICLDFDDETPKFNQAATLPAIVRFNLDGSASSITRQIALGFDGEFHTSSKSGTLTLPKRDLSAIDKFWPNSQVKVFKVAPSTYEIRGYRLTEDASSHLKTEEFAVLRYQLVKP